MNFSNDSNSNGSVGDPKAAISLAMWYTYVILAPTLVIFGTFGNIIGFLMVKQQCGPSVALLFQILSVASICATFTYLVPTFVFHAFGTNMRSEVDAVCKIFSFVNYTSGDLAIWVVVLLSVDRYVAVAHPIRAKNWCNLRFARRSAIGLTVLVSLRNVHILVTRGVSNGRCYYQPGPLYNYETQVRPWVTLFVAALLPLTFMCYFNTAVAFKLFHFQKKWLPKSSNNNNNNNNNNSNNSNSTVKNFRIKYGMAGFRRREAQAIKLSLISSFLYVITVFPVFIVNVVDKFVRVPSDVQAVTNLLLYAIYSLHYYVYCAIGTAFRQAFLRQICCKNSPNSGRAESVSNSTAVAENLNQQTPM